MSLILEALKKSEAERQRRQTPGLMTPSLTPRRRGLWRWLAALALLPLTLLGGWWLGQLDSEPEPSVLTQTSVPGPAAETEGSPTPSAPSAAPETSARENPPRQPQTSADARESTRDPVAAARPPREREGAAMPAPAADDPLLDPELDDATRAQLAEVLGTLPDPPAPETSPSERAPAEPRDSAAATGAAQPPSPAPRETSDGPAPMHELPFQLRRDIPEIRVSMVVSSGDASARFALVNGERRTEGEEVAPGVRLVQISAQTLELEFRGQRFLLRQGSR